MTSPIHPELRGVARLLPRRAVSERSLPFIRFLTGLLARRRPDDVELHSVGDVSVRLHRPPRSSGGALPAILWIHGGGYVIGSAAQDDAICRRFAVELGAIVAAVEYRLAPEHAFPTPLEDCHDALVWLASRDEVDADRVAIGGASAGGGLAAGLALLARQRGDVRPAAQVLAYPMLDDRTVLRNDLDERYMRLWNNRTNRFGWTAYTGLPPGSPAVSELAVPARSDDLSGLPPAWIGVGTLDLFHDEDVAYAGRLATPASVRARGRRGRLPWLRRHQARNERGEGVLRRATRGLRGRVHRQPASGRGGGPLRDLRRCTRRTGRAPGRGRGRTRSASGWMFALPLLGVLLPPPAHALLERVGDRLAQPGVQPAHLADGIALHGPEVHVVEAVVAVLGAEPQQPLHPHRPVLHVELARGSGGRCPSLNWRPTSA